MTLLREDEKFLYFMAKTPEFGSFVITGKELSNHVENEPESNEEAAPEPEIAICNGTRPKEKLSMPGLEISYGIAGLLVVFLYKKSK